MVQEKHPYIQRRRVLTDEDIDAIAQAMAAHGHGCNMGLTPDQATTIKRILVVFDKAAGIIGTIVLTTLAMAVTGIFTKGFWLSLITGIKDAGK